MTWLKHLEGFRFLPTPMHGFPRKPIDDISGRIEFSRDKPKDRREGLKNSSFDSGILCYVLGVVSLVNMEKLENPHLQNENPESGISSFTRGSKKPPITNMYTSLKVSRVTLTAWKTRVCNDTTLKREKLERASQNLSGMNRRDKNFKNILHSYYFSLYES